eukprot:s722_g7.t1
MATMACAVDEADKAFAADVLGGCFGQGGDFTVVVEERVAGKSGQDAEVVRTEFKVWSVLLSQWSKVFHTMTTSTSFREKAAAEVVIQDFSATTVEAFLRFLYSGVLRGSLATTVEEPTTTLEETFKRTLKINLPWLLNLAMKDRPR